MAVVGRMVRIDAQDGCGVGDFPVGDQLVGKGFDLFGVQADAHRGGGDLLCFERYVHGAVARRDVGIVTRATA